MKIVAFNGSARKNGNTAHLLRGCTACFKCSERKNGRCAVEDDAMNDYIAKMVAADGILLGSPTYFADVSAGMKALIERCGMVTRANGDLLKRKVGAGVVAVRRAGASHVFSSLNSFFLIGQMIVVGSSYWNIGIGRAPGEVANDEEGVRTMRDLGRNMAWLMKKIQD
ncbi:MAG: flavodoxin family protein [Deltaproteobacteria bacterium]